MNKPEDAVTFAEYYLPCHCHNGFVSRGLIDPSCPRHNYSDSLVDGIRLRDCTVARLTLLEAIDKLKNDSACAMIKPSRSDKFVWDLSREACLAELNAIAERINEANQMKKSDREALWRQENPRDQALIILGAIRGHLSNVEDGITDGKMLPEKLNKYLDDMESLVKVFMSKEWSDD